MWGITQAVEASAVFVAGVVLIFSVVWSCFLVFIPLVKTIAGKVQVLRIYGMKRAIRTDLDRALDSFISDLELGPTMADGGEKTEKEQGAWSRRRYKKKP